MELKIFRNLCLISCLFLIISQIVYGQSTKAGPKVLDFEDDVIEGERKTPNIFTEIEPHRPALDLILYQRNNFNDFHSIERGRRPRYISGRSIPVPVKSVAPVRTGASVKGTTQQPLKKGK